MRVGTILSINEIKDILVEELENLHEFCNNNGIRYYLSGGTLLGAIRHQGFIPWDDDIDLIMPRSDYMRFIELTKHGMGENYRVFSSYTNNHHVYPFIKVCDKRTKLREFRHKNADGMGVFIDIFPMDGISDEQTVADKQLTKILFLRTCLKYACTSVFTSTNFLLTLPRLIIIGLCKAVGCNRIIRLIETLAVSSDFDTSDMAAVLVWGYKQKERIPRSIFEPQVLVKFENKSFYTTSGYDTYLSNLYGDYRMLPPEAKRIRKHDYEVVWSSEIQ